MKEFRVIAVTGTREDARWFSYSANITHGMRRNREDIRKAVIAALKHPKGAKLSDSKIAEHVGVSHVTVAARRRELEATCQIDKSSEREGQDGRTYKTDNIGKGRRHNPADDYRDSQPASVTGTLATSSATSPPSLPSEGTVSQTEQGSQGDGDAGGECPHGGDHTWGEDDCTRCHEPLPIPDVIPLDTGDGFDPANIEAHAESFAANFAARVKAHNLEIDRYCQRIKAAFDNDLPRSPWFDDSRHGIVGDQIHSALGSIRQAKVHSKPCPKCDGKGKITGKDCKTCRAYGMLPKVSYEMAGGQ
jgi:hypothetical protein